MLDFCFIVLSYVMLPSDVGFEVLCFKKLVGIYFDHQIHYDNAGVLFSILMWIPQKAGEPFC